MATKTIQNCVLVEGPARGDADFCGRWLLAAAKADTLLSKARARDPDFGRIIFDLEFSRFFSRQARPALAVFATKTGWRAKVYPEGSENVEKLRARLEAKAALLSEQYELVL